MKTKQKLRKNPTSDVGEVLTALKKVNNRVLPNDEIVGTYSVEIGSATVYLKENENDDTFSTIGRGQFMVHFNSEESKLFYVTDNIRKEQLRFMNNRGQIDHGRFFSEDEILAVSLCNDAYERIHDKLSEMYEYNEQRIKTNHKQADLISKLGVADE